MAHLLRYFVLCLLSEFLIAFSLLNNHNSSIRNMTGGLVTNDALGNTDIFRQLLNQEAIIRVALEQNIHSLMKDILTVKNSVLVLETTAEKFKLATEKTVFQLEAEVEMLKSENQRLRKDNADIQRKLILYVNGTFQTVKDSISQMQKSFDTRLQMIEANVSSIATLETSLAKVSTQMGNLSKSVAFTAGVTPESSTWNSGTLVFNRVINNLGGGYNPNTGIFTAPVDGVYVFYVSIQSNRDNSVFVDIILNGSKKVRAMAHVVSTNDGYETGTNLATLRLQQGDTVWVKHYAGSGYYSTGDSLLTTFSGFLI